MKLYTVGNIYKIFNSGIIDYEIDENALVGNMFVMMEQSLKKSFIGNWINPD